MKVAYNNCYGGFGLSYQGVMRYAVIKGMNIYAFVDERDSGGRSRIKLVPYDPSSKEEPFLLHYGTKEKYSNDTYWSDRDIERDDPALIQVIEELGDKASGRCAKLAIADLPSGTLYRIDEYDGNESVMTQDSYSWSVAR